MYLLQMHFRLHSLTDIRTQSTVIKIMFSRQKVNKFKVHILYMYTQCIQDCIYSFMKLPVKMAFCVYKWVRTAWVQM